MGKPSQLTPLERMALRNGYIYAKRRGIKYTQGKKVKDLQRVGRKFTGNRITLLSAACKFVANLSVRTYLPIKLSPCIIKNAIRKDLLLSLQRFLKAKVSPKLGLTKGESVEPQISGEPCEGAGERDGLVFDVTEHGNEDMVELESWALKAVRGKLVEFGRKHHYYSWEYWDQFVEEFDAQVDSKHLPLRASIVLHQKNGKQDMTQLKNNCAMYAAVVCVVFESGCVNHNGEEIGSDEPLPEGTIMLLNPTALHEVPIVVRKTRAVIVLTF